MRFWDDYYPGLTQKSIWGFMKQLQSTHMSSTSRETKWRLGRESNPQPLDHEADTLPLHHRNVNLLTLKCPSRECQQLQFRNNPCLGTWMTGYTSSKRYRYLKYLEKYLQHTVAVGYEQTVFVYCWNILRNVHTQIFLQTISDGTHWYGILDHLYCWTTSHKSDICVGSDRGF
jgi:hypothetical protein